MSDEELIAYCGLYCGDCHGHQQKIPDLARDLRKELRAQRYDLFAKMASEKGFNKDLAEYETCYKVLGAMVKFRCNKACRPGGGPPFCKMRQCCQRKGYNGCWECDDFETCDKLDFLKDVHGDAHIKNLRRLKKNGVKAFVKGRHEWYSKPKKR